MTLTKYNQKRNFKNTSEPAGKAAKSHKVLRFVIQKHHASHLHYDFRLEMDGVLKSWAVPKGPSLNPADKRLAMMVEDHPYSYIDFEGNIADGNYGAGNVIVWDNGTYTITPDAKNGGDPSTGVKNGHLNFTLKGKKLKGEFSLVKLKNGRQENAWLLIKKEDQYASEKDVTLNDKSVISKKTLQGLAEKYHNQKNGSAPDEKKKSKSASSTKTVKKKSTLSA